MKCFMKMPRVSRVLEITLTKRDASKSNSDVWCCIYHSPDDAINTLVNNGYKVAICEQMEDPPKQTKGMVRREVVKLRLQEL